MTETDENWVPAFIEWDEDLEWILADTNLVQWDEVMTPDGVGKLNSYGRKYANVQFSNRIREYPISQNKVRGGKND